MTNTNTSERAGLTKAQATFLAALNEHGRLSAPTGNPPVMKLAKAGLMTFAHRSEELSVMEITEAGRAALSKAST
jgi:DNA-binding MarR family transcriptional regulator